MAVRNPYPERDGNSFELLPGAEAFLPAMELAIHHARDYVLFEQYLVISGDVADHFIDAFIAAAGRGAKVFMLLDHFGARALSAADRQRLVDAGVALIFYNPAFLSHVFRGLPRNHRKLLLIDGRQAFTGGAGITDDYGEKSVTLPWYDVMLKMEGPVVADWQAQFERTWLNWGGEIELPEPADEASGTQSGRLSPSMRGLKKFPKKELLRRIRSASERAWLGTAYFLPSRTLMRAMRAARRRGVDVRLLLPGPINDHPAVYHAGRRYYHNLLRHGIRIYEYHPAFMHAKAYLADDWCSIGSCNMDRWGLRWNLEANLESSDAGLCDEVEAFFHESFAHSHEITLEAWLKRPLAYRLSEWTFGYMDLLIERFGLYRELQKGKRFKDTIFNPRP
jgi:phosphatidylserine/phosphatidylglycerophosphate/cardiolipin synthase-like enzyme